MFLTINFQHALVILESPKLIREEMVVPADLPLHPDCPYRSGYDWLYRYERELLRFLAPWLSRYRYELIGEKGILCEALSNAFCHGHRKDPHLPIELRVFRGKKGLLVQIKDNGQGFYVEDVLNRYQKNKRYYCTAGNGFHLMASSTHFGIFYDRSGNIFHLLYLFDENLDTLPAFAFHSTSARSRHRSTGLPSHQRPVR